MKNEGIILGVFAVLFLLLIIFLVCNLTYKNTTLKYISDDTRQLELLENIVTGVVNEKVEEENIVLTCDSEFYLNFVNNTSFVVSQREEIDELLESVSSSDENSTKYTISSSFDVKKLCLTIYLETQSIEKPDVTKTYEIVYKLGKNKKDNTIKYKEKSFTTHLTGS